MITLKVDLESTKNYGMSIYKGSDSNFYMFSDCGDLLYKPKKTYWISVNEVWEFAIGTFKLNEDRIITQTQEYFEKYYVCDKAAYGESLNIPHKTFTVTNNKTLLVVKAENKPDSVSWGDLCTTLKDFEVVDLAAPPLKETSEETYTGINGTRFNIPHLKIQLEQGSIIYPRQNKRARCKVDGDGYVLLEKDIFLPKHYLTPEVEWVLEGNEAATNIKVEQYGNKPLVDNFLEKQTEEVITLLLSACSKLIDLQKGK
jgi:hypothetical protein